ncbi:MAG TPA: 50S ribosomal protein L24 [Solirubrobacteraceae bacterium]|jgi:large subunit ribosomal protein L24|nr:50S ribosomal protein L24 [Solirubrobacteraceae bacterium]
MGRASRDDGGRRPLKIRSGDQVQVIGGKDRGKSGRVLRVEPRKQRVYVEGLNMVKRHVRPKQVAGAHTEAALGGVIDREGPIHISNVMLLDPKGRPTRIGIEREGGHRIRVAKISGTRLD